MPAEIEIRRVRARSRPDALFSLFSPLPPLSLFLFYTANCTDRKALVRHLSSSSHYIALCFTGGSIAFLILHHARVARTPVVVATVTLIGNFFVSTKFMHSLNFISLACGNNHFSRLSCNEQEEQYPPILTVIPCRREKNTSVNERMGK